MRVSGLRPFLKGTPPPEVWQQEENETPRKKGKGKGLTPPPASLKGTPPPEVWQQEENETPRKKGKGKGLTPPPASTTGFAWTTSSTL